MMKVKIEFEKPNVGKTAGRIFSDDVLMYFGQQAAKQMTPYVPMDQGPLSQNYIVTTKYVEYQMPYAHRQFNGDNFNFSKDMHPLATAHWDRAMMAARKDRLTQSVENYIKTKRK